MNTYSLSHLSDHTLLRGLASLVARDRATTAELLAHIAEVDARRLYLPAAHPTMHSYCVHELRLSEEAAFKRIRAARAARRFPAIFAAVADGRLHLSAVVLLAPYLMPETAGELLAAAAHRTKAEIERLLAERFPRPELAFDSLAPGPVEALGLGDAHSLSPGTVETLGLGHADSLAPGTVETLGLGDAHSLSPGTVTTLDLGDADSLAPGPVETPGPGHVPLGSTGRITLRLAVTPATYDKLRYAQSLLSHRLPSGDVGAVFERALDALISQLEKRKFAATTRPRPSLRRTGGATPRAGVGSPAAGNARHIPAHVKRAVWTRDQGQCTFTSDKGQRCPARKFLEFDHVDEVARGGRASVALIRLRCRAHNQYTAEQTFGAEFMRHKREQARAAARATSAASGRRGERVLPAVREPAAPVPIQRSPAPHSPAECTPIEHLPIERVPSPHMPVEGVRVFVDPKSRPTDQDRDVVPWLRRLGFSAAEARRMATRCDELLPDGPLEERIRAALSRTGRASEAPRPACT